jgi:hypothetical protein
VAAAASAVLEAVAVMEAAAMEVAAARASRKERSR